MKLSSLSILIPAYNDETTIVRVVKRAVQAGRLYAKRFEIVVCNDASPDRLASVLTSLQRTVPEMRIITHRKNKGYGGTLKDLYGAGINDWLFTVPGDYQIDPMELKNFLPGTLKGDMIIGWRRKRHDTPARKRQSVIYNRVLTLLYGIHLHDVNSVRLMKRTVMKGRIITSTSAFVDAELTIGAIRDGYHVIETPIAHRRRETGGAGGGKASVIIPVIWDMIRGKVRRAAGI